VPELPEVETIRRQLAPLVTGRTVVRVEAHPSVKFAAAAAVAGATVAGVDRRGKYLLWALEDDRELVVHLGMTGVLRLGDGATAEDPYVRARWHLDDGTALELRDIRRFGRIAVVPTGQYATLPTLQRLGPEPFDDAFTPEGLWRAMGASSVRVKTQLLNQRVVAGVGNIYADEALWRAGVDPGARRITRARAVALHGAVREVLDAGIVHGGTTLRDYRTPAGGTGDNQHHLACYGRAGQPCPRCGTILRRRLVDARGTTWCPRCQSQRL
jgi:formamidopyrimidine-DNA glycosylase